MGRQGGGLTENGARRVAPPSAGWALLLALALLAGLLGACRGVSSPPVAAPREVAAPGTTPALAVMVMPDDGRTPLINALRGARESIRLTIYLLIDNDVVDELMRAHQRGVDVRVLVEPNPFGGGPASRDDVAKLRAAGVQVRDGNPTFRYTHQKSVVVDDAVALIMTLNLTPSSFTKNREHGVIDTNPTRVAEIARVFDADWSRRDVAVSDADLVWSPNNARDRLLALLASATASVEIEAEVLTDANVTRTLGNLAQRGVKVRVILPPAEAGDLSLADLDAMTKRGAQLRRLDDPYPHTKLIIVDGTRAYLGSINLTANSLDNNRELGIIIDDPAGLRRLRDSFEADWPGGP